MTFLTISKLIDRLEKYKDQYGDLPILLGIADEDERQFIYRLLGTSIMDIKNMEDPTDKQRCLVLLNNKLEEG